MFPGIWRHGDWIKITERGSAVIYGRSDSTINRGGVRMGTSEIYSAVEGDAEVLDRLVVDVEEQMLLFVVLRDGRRARRRAARDDPPARARALLAAPRAGRDRAIAEVPRTLSNKKLEVPVKKILLGADPAERGEPRLARQSGGARLVRRPQRSGGLSSSSSRSANSTQNSSTSASVSSSRRAPSPHDRHGGKLRRRAA